MTFLAPGFLVAALALAGVVIALHFLSRRYPAAIPFPPMRFVPEPRDVPSARAITLKDTGLLALRLAIVMLTGLALAKPVMTGRRRAVARVVILDRSRAVRSEAELLDSARSVVGQGDVQVWFDSTVAVLRNGTIDSASARPVTSRRGSLSAALLTAWREASLLRDAADSMEMVVVSPLVVEEWDAATDSIRALWPGRIRLVRVAARADSAVAAGIAVRGDVNDPIQFALTVVTPAPNDNGVRLIRDQLGRDDSTWARDRDHVAVLWPSDLRTLSQAGWSTRTLIDTTGAVVAGDAVVVAPFERTMIPPPVDSASGVAVVARWVDGTPAALERQLGAGCLRTVAVPVPARGDLVLDPYFARFVRAMLAPCGGARRTASVSAREAARLSAPMRPQRVSRASILATPEASSRLTVWLLMAALALFALEPLVRRRVRESRS